MARNITWLSLLVSIGVATAAAQQGTASTNPQTTSNPKPPTLVISGCLADGSGSTTGRSGAASAMAQSRYSLQQVKYGSSGPAFDEWLRAHPPTGTMARTGPSGSGGIRDGRPTELQLGTEPEKDVDLSKYVRQQIEVTGTLGPVPGADKQAGAGSRTTARDPSRNTSTAWEPRLIVTAVKSLSGECK